MSVRFLDSSALVKRYVAETGTTWIDDLSRLERGNTLVVARIGWIEGVSALARRQREGNAPAQLVAQAVQTLRQDFQTQYEVLELDGEIDEVAADLLFKHPLRAYDALQLASALHVQRALMQTGAMRLIFVSADERLLRVAQVEGMLTDNPNNHP